MSSKRVLFVHPDLGIGGAERLVVDSAVGLQQLGWNVTIITSHHDPEHCFPETRDGTLNVVVAGDFLPRSILGKFRLLCVMIRMIYVALYAILFCKGFDVVFCDQLSLIVPILLLSGKKVLFYCHFPDLLLTSRRNLVKKLYRYPLDWIEEKTTGCASKILVNSQFTESVFRKTFKSLAKCPVTILNPAVDFSKLHGVHVAEEKLPEMISQWQNFSGDFVLVLSINRFERKKNIQLAVYAFAYLKQKKGLDLSNVKLILSGGYDIRESENVEYDLELREICKLSNLSVSDFPDFQGEVVFFHSLTDDQKSYLLSKCRCVVYTPSNEHFGIVPLEAMFSRKPVVAIANGGPLETIVHKETGYLCEDDSQLVESFAESIQQLLQNPSLAERMGKSGRDRAQTKFSLDHFSRSLDSALNSLIN